MERLREIARIISSQRGNRVEIIGDNSNRDGLSNRFYKLLASGKLKNEAQAIQVLYGDSTKKDLFLKLKNRLQNRLVNSLFFINSKNNNEALDTYNESHKKWAAIKILLAGGARNSAVFLAEKTIKKTIRYETTLLTLDLAKMLRRHYAIYSYNKKKYEHYSSLVQETLALLEAETKAEEYFEQITFNYIKSRARKQELVAQVKEYATRLKTVPPTQRSYRFDLVAHLIYSLQYEVACDYHNVIVQNEEAIAYFSTKKKEFYRSPTFHFYQKILVACIALRKFDKGFSTTNKCLEHVNDGVMNWFIALEHYIILCFHSQKYEEAYNTYSEATQHKDFKKLTQVYQEIWRVYAAFFHLLFLAGKLDSTAPNFNIVNFRVGKFLNEVPEYAKDKKGINISILILQILLFLKQKKYDQVIKRVSPLENYIKRHLKDPNAIRSSCFIKMITQVVNAKFQKERSIKAAAKYLRKLQTTPAEKIRQSTYMEIFPFEVLWNIILEQLDNRVVY